jgi:hypothetical protein
MVDIHFNVKIVRDVVFANMEQINIHVKNVVGKEFANIIELNKTV